MKPILGLVYHARVLLALALLVFAGLGQSLPVHAGMTQDGARQSLHAMMPMPVDHAVMNAASDSDQAICEFQCLALTLALPISPFVAAPIRRVRMALAPAALLPAPDVSGPEGPPPKAMLL